MFVDTPGFDDTYKSDIEILSMIADWLVNTCVFSLRVWSPVQYNSGTRFRYKQSSNLATIIYMHRISDNRMSGSVLKNLKLFASLCGMEAMPNVIIATTM